VQSNRMLVDPVLILDNDWSLEVFGNQRVPSPRDSGRS
jgi:hypothetical protein